MLFITFVLYLVFLSIPCLYVYLYLVYILSSIPISWRNELLNGTIGLRPTYTIWWSRHFWWNSSFLCWFLRVSLKPTRISCMWLAHTQIKKVSGHARPQGSINQASSINIHHYPPPLRWIIVNYALVCKTQWTRARVITFQPNFETTATPLYFSE